MTKTVLLPLYAAALVLAAASCRTVQPPSDHPTPPEATPAKSAESESPEPPIEPPVSEPTAAQKELARKLRGAIEKAQDTPGQEGANFLSTGWRASMIRELAGEKPATEKRLENVEKKMRALFGEGIANAPEWPVPPPVDIPRAGSEITVDGTLDEPAWQNAWHHVGMSPFNKQEEVLSPRTDWYITWDEKALYFAFKVQDTHIVSVDEVNPEKETPDVEVWRKDCVEMFILPDFETRRYVEYVVSPRGTVFDAIHVKAAEKFGAESSDIEQDLEAVQVATSIRGTVNEPEDEDEGYTVEIALPFSELPFAEQTEAGVPGMKLHFILCRLNAGPDGMTPYAHQPLLSWGHNIWNHGVMRLVAE